MSWVRPVVAGLAVLLAGPPAAAQVADPAAVDHFEKKVRPVLAEHCFGCHGNTKQQAGLRLDSRARALAGGDTGPAVTPGDPDTSLLVTAVRSAGDLKMPPKGRLSAHQVAAIEEWVRAGAVWPDRGDQPHGSSDHKPHGSSTDGPLFTAEQRAFWAFQPVKDGPPPAVRDAGWVRTPVDAFVLAKLEAAGLRPSPPADPLVWLRRVTFDLTGLPPTPEEVASFEQSPITNHQSQMAAVVDRLLASPAYGERWGRHWLDVARYADTNGQDENTAFANAWRYRDYVVRSFNRDKPFAEFVREQLAGDLLPPAADPAAQADRLTALGYLAIGPKLLAEPDKQKMLLDVADEQLDTVGKGLLGLTVGCARCHDHKSDPLPTRDYYGLLAVFTGTRTMQSLDTVAKAFERPLPGTTPGQIARAKDAAAKVEAKRKEARDAAGAAEREPDPAKRKPLGEKADALKAELAALRKAAPAAEMVLAVEDGSAAAYGTRPRNLHVQVRGNYSSPGEEAPAVFPRILAGDDQPEFVSTRPDPAAKAEPNTTRFGRVRARSGRLELANWLTRPDHPLTARVWVNRVWQHHFGDGLVRTPDNFGRLGDRPSHPELLDWLAARFVADGWSTKKLHRLTVLSAAYAQSSTTNEPSQIQDSGNRLLWRYPRRRLEAEAVRDAVLAAAGTLDRAAGGPALATAGFEYVRDDVGYDSRRRSVYLPVVRGGLFPFFQAFDFPDPTTPCGKRAATVVAPQALYLLNNPFVVRQARAFADRVLAADPTDPGRVRLAYRLALGRGPSAGEVGRAVDFLARYEAALGPAEPDPAERRPRAWQAFCQGLFAGNEFVHLD